MPRKPRQAPFASTARSLDMYLPSIVEWRANFTRQAMAEVMTLTVLVTASAVGLTRITSPLVAQIPFNSRIAMTMAVISVLVAVPPLLFLVLAKHGLDATTRRLEEKEALLIKS